MTQRLAPQQFVLIRGHQGAGKSTFAQQLIARFQEDYPHATIEWIENDRCMTDTHGVYHFSPEALQQAIVHGEQRFQSALHRASITPALLIVNSNTNQSAARCQWWLRKAQQHGLVCTVFRLHHFYPNVHQVPEAEVWAAYRRLNEQVVVGEIHVPARHNPLQQTGQAREKA